MLNSIAAMAWGWGVSCAAAMAWARRRHGARAGSDVVLVPDPGGARPPASQRAPAPRSAPPRPLHPWRGPGSARPRPRTAPAGSGGRREMFPGGRRRRVRGAVGARRGAGGAIRGDAGAAGLPGPLPNAAPAPAAARAPDIAHIVKMRGLRSARAAAFLQRKDLAPEPGVLTIDRTRYIHEWGRRWSATALKGE